MENGKLKMEEMPEALHPFLHAEFLHFQFFHGSELFALRPWLSASVPQQSEQFPHAQLDVQQAGLHAGEPFDIGSGGVLLD